jgi:hypothetical protein
MYSITLTNYSPDDGGSVVLGNVSNTAHIHIVPAPKSRISINRKSIAVCSENWIKSIKGLHG